MMNKRLFLIFFLLSISFLGQFVVKTALAAEVKPSSDSFLTKIQEKVEYFFAFRVEKKVQVLEKHAEKRLTLAQSCAEEGEDEEVSGLLQNYLQIKEKQNNLLGKTGNGDVLGAVEGRTVEQQKTMEEIKTKVEGEVKQQVVEVQEQVVNQVAQRIIEVNGSEGVTEFFQKVEHVWAAGTGPGGEAGVVIEGGTMQFAPGTSAGGNSQSDIQNVVVVEDGGNSGGGGSGEGGNQGLAPGTSSGGAGTTIVGE